mmetsp:Transcript_4853/g.10309  ORF Transcript_4853/g.10309 Transcript_4853/m.10309 type:complete len:190 (-) Transcript_4853:1659-2228(-)
MHKAQQHTLTLMVFFMMMQVTSQVGTLSFLYLDHAILSADIFSIGIHYLNHSSIVAIQAKQLIIGRRGQIHLEKIMASFPMLSMSMDSSVGAMSKNWSNDTTRDIMKIYESNVFPACCSVLWGARAVAKVDIVNPLGKKLGFQRFQLSIIRTRVFLLSDSYLVIQRDKRRVLNPLHEFFHFATRWDDFR